MPGTPMTRPHRPDPRPLPVAGWKGIGVLPPASAPERPAPEHDMGEEEKNLAGNRLRFRCICGWRGAYFPTQSQAEQSLFAHCEREAVKARR